MSDPRYGPEPNWAQLAQDENFRRLFACAKVAGMMDRQHRELLRPGGPTDPEVIGRLRGWLAAVEFLRDLPANQVRHEERVAELRDSQDSPSGLDEVAARGR